MAKIEARSRCIIALVLFLIILTTFLVDLATAQGIRQSPYSSPSLLRGWSGSRLNTAPSNPLGRPGSAMPWGGAGVDSILITDGMLRGIIPLIPNLQVGYLYDFGKARVRSGRFTLDYLLPIGLSHDSIIFGEIHTESQNFFKKPDSNTWRSRGFNNRLDLSLGGGYRKLIARDSLVGLNGFYDTTRLGATWYSSGSVGFETASLVSGSDALDLNFNWYGRLFESDVIRNAFRYGPSNFDFEAGYSHELWEGGPDLRLRIKGYQFDIGTRVYGGNAGAELRSRDGMFSLKYDVGNDKINQTYQTIGGFVNVGFQLENLLKGESPFTMPEPIFKSPRNLRYLMTQRVKRDFHQSSSVVVSRAVTTGASGGARSLILLEIAFTDDASHQGHLECVYTQTGSNSFDVTVPEEGSNCGFIYTFQMSDNSIQTVRGTITPESNSPININTVNTWFGPDFYVGQLTGLMNDAVVATTDATFNQVGGVTLYHLIWTANNPRDTFSGQVVIDVPSDPTITPIIINFRVNP